MASKAHSLKSDTFAAKSERDSPSLFHGSPMETDFDRYLQTESSPILKENGCKRLRIEANVKMQFCGGGLFITLSTPKRKGIFSRVLRLLPQHNLEILDATLSTTSTDDYLHLFYAKVANAAKLEVSNLERELRAMAGDEEQQVEMQQQPAATSSSSSFVCLEEVEGWESLPSLRSVVAQPSPALRNAAATPTILHPHDNNP